MMNSQMPSRNDDHSLEELDPRLREAVEEIVADQPPEDFSRRTIERLRTQPPTAKSRRWHVAVYIAWASAACVAGALLAWQWTTNEGDGDRVVTVPPKDLPVEPKPPTDSPPSELPRPTLWAYRQAAAESGDEFDRLLNEHAEKLAFSDPGSSRLSLSPLLHEGSL